MCEGGGNCLKHLIRRWNRKEGRGNKYFKEGGKLGPGVNALKRGNWNPLTNYGFSYCFDNLCPITAVPYIASNFLFGLASSQNPIIGGEKKNKFINRDDRLGQHQNL